MSLSNEHVLSKTSKISAEISRTQLSSTSMKHMVARIIGQRKSDRKNTIDTVIVRMGFQFKFTRGHKHKTAHLVSKFGIFRGLFLWCNNGNQLQCNINTLGKILTIFFIPTQSSHCQSSDAQVSWCVFDLVCLWGCDT